MMGLISDFLGFFGFVHKSKLMYMNIKLGNGVKFRAPIKLNMTYDEWSRMNLYINSRLNVLTSSSNLINSNTSTNLSKPDNSIPRPYSL